MSQTLIAHLADALYASKALEIAAERMADGKDVTVAIPLSARPFFVAASFARNPRSMLVVLAGESAAHLFMRDLSIWLSNEVLLRFPARSDYPWSGQPFGDDVIQTIGQRFRALDALVSNEPKIVVTSARALLRILPPVNRLNTSTHVHTALSLTFTVGEHLTHLPYKEIPVWLSQHGYTRLDTRDTVGTFSMRGDVLDLFPAGSSYPVRVEFFGDEIEHIRRVVPATGQSIGELASLTVYPAHEITYGKEQAARAEQIILTLEGEEAAALPEQVRYHLEQLKQGVPFRAAERYVPFLYEQPATLIDYLHSDAQVVLVEPRSVADDAQRGHDEIIASADLAYTRPKGLYHTPAELNFGKQQRLTLLSLMTSGAAPDARLEVKHLDVAGSPEKIALSASGLLANTYRVVLGIPHRRAREDVLLALSDEHVSFTSWEESTLQTLSSQIVTATDLAIPTSFSLPDAKIAFLTLSDNKTREAAVRGRSSKSTASGVRRTIDPTLLTFPYKPGDYVVHATHGIALFKAIVRREVAGIERDYLHLEYAKGDKLFTPVEQIDRVTRYVGPESSAPRLTRLNTSDWSRALTKARKAARQMAFDLVDLYARRTTARGFAFEPDDETQRAMEAEFPYEETPDQLEAIADVKADMETRKPMDRLIVGDVGFGKTEVALRAAFKAACNGKQAMLLCPTTILAQQHYTTFSERFEPYGVAVDVLSRFRTAKQQRDILKRFAEGKLDVLIGTHRLLSADVNPRDLGLIIIDEEQRFGVQHKEQLKTLREQVDVLTLSATPIPRTMNMAISGVRDLSLINTPPRSRTPVKVHVGEWNEDVVSAAIRHEIQRGGQVYYVSNRVKDLGDAEARVISAAPEARIGVAHGKLTPTQLERIMERFAANELDVLIATTIIESGLDNPHTNTLIIEDSQRLGLNQLYQLKGRVGRSYTQAFAYFLFPSQQALTPEAIERLTAIDEFQGLGSGTKIAMRDLEIRGAGSLFGAEQHGMLSAVGFDLFAAMLKDAVDASTAAYDVSVLKDSDIGEVRARQENKVRIEVAVPYFLPEEYVPAVDERVLWYRRIAGAYSLETLSVYELQIEESYGALPAPARNLFDRERAKVCAAELGIQHIALIRGKLSLEPLELAAKQREWAKQQGGTYFSQTHKLLFPAVTADSESSTLEKLLNLLETLLTFAM